MPRPNVCMAPGYALIPSPRARAFIVVEAGQRWRCKDKRYANHEIRIVRKVDGRAYYKDPAGAVRYVACEDLRRRFEYVAERADDGREGAKS